MTKNIFSYIAFVAINSSIPFFTMPILTRNLSPDQYGSVTIFGVYASIIGALIGFSTLTAFIKIYFNERYDNRVYLTTTILISFISTLLLLFIAYFFDESVSEMYGIPLWWIYGGIFMVFFDSIISAQSILFRMEEKIFYFGIFDFSRIALRALLMIYLVVFLDFKEDGVIISGVLSSSIFLAFTFYLLFKNGAMSININRVYMKHALNFGLPLTPHVIFGVLSTMIDKITIVYLLSKEELGLYAVGFAIGAIIKALEAAVYQAYQPWFFKEISSKNCDNKKIVRFSYLIVTALLITSLILSLISYSYFELYVGKNYGSGVDIIPWIAFGFAVNGMYTMVNQVVLYEEKTHVISVITVLSVLLGVALNYVLINLNGVIGAAQAFLLLMAIRTITMWIYSNNLHPLGWFNLNKN